MNAKSCWEICPHLPFVLPSQVLIWLLVLSCQGDVSPIKCKARRFQKCSQIHTCLQIQRQRQVTHWAKILTDCHIFGLSWDHLSVFILTLGMQSVWSDAKSPVNGDIWRVPPRRLPRLSMRPSSRSKSFGSRLTIGDGNTNMSCTIHKFHKFHKTHTQFKKEGYFFRHFFLTSFWLLAPSASGFWLVACGFWLLAAFFYGGYLFLGQFYFCGGFLACFFKGCLGFFRSGAASLAICCILELKSLICVLFAAC